MARPKTKGDTGTTPKGIRFHADVIAGVRRLARRPGSFSAVVNTLLREALAARQGKEAA